MKILEYGNASKPKIILIHGFQSPWQVWEHYIEHFKGRFHIIVPIITGHNPEEKEDFISFADTARQLEDWYISRYGNEVHAVFGMSMGGVLTATLWQNGRLKISKLIADGSPLASPNNLVRQYMKSFYLSVTHKVQRRDKKTLKQACSICPEQYLDSFISMLDNMSDNTIINCISGITDFKLSPDNPQTELYYFHGTAMNEMLAKKSAKLISKHYPNAAIRCFKGKFHCENSLFYPEVMIKELERIF